MEDKDPAAVALAAKRRIVDGVCAVCGKPIRGTIRRRLCSNRCKVAAYVERRRAAEPAP